MILLQKNAVDKHTSMDTTMCVKYRCIVNYIHVRHSVTYNRS